MKHLYLIGGTMGVGKTTVSQCLKKQLHGSVFLDGDWCWDAHPFQVTKETKEMVMDNIRHLLQNFLRCPAYEHVIFCWVMHEQEIISDILSGLDTKDCAVHCISLLCSEAALAGRLQKDVDDGLRTADVISRSMARLPLYAALDTVKIHTDGKAPGEIAGIIAAMGEK